VTENAGKSQRLTCSYHGWSYDHEGELKGMRDSEDFKDFDMSCRGLKKIRCEPTPKGKSPLDSLELSPDIARIETAGEIARTCTQSYGLFPNWVSPLSQFAIAPILFWPNGINKCRMETWTMAPQWKEGMKPDLWTVNERKELCNVLLEDTQFGEKIQQSMESQGFEGVPLSYQEARIYHWNQQADKMIGVDNVPSELRVQQVIGDNWIFPNDPRQQEMLE